MKNERMKILELLQSGVINADEAEKLLNAIDAKPEEGSVKTVNKRKMLKVIVNSKSGDKVNIQIPIEFAKILKSESIKKQIKIDDIDIEIDDIISMVEEGALGEIVNIDSSDGDKVRIVIE